MDKNNICSVCGCSVDDDAAVLTLSGSGMAKMLCPECEHDFDILTESTDISEIKGSMERVSKKMSDFGVEEKTVLRTVDEIMNSAKERAEMIKCGDYRLSEEKEEEEVLEIPEEYRESEEDKELDRRDEERNKKADKIINIICIAAVAVTAAFLIYTLVKTLF